MTKLKAIFNKMSKKTKIIIYVIIMVVVISAGCLAGLIHYFKPAATILNEQATNVPILEVANNKPIHREILKSSDDQKWYECVGSTFSHDEATNFPELVKPQCDYSKPLSSFRTLRIAKPAIDYSIDYMDKFKDFSTSRGAWSKRVFCSPLPPSSPLKIKYIPHKNYDDETYGREVFALISDSKGKYDKSKDKEYALKILSDALINEQVDDIDSMSQYELIKEGGSCPVDEATNDGNSYDALLRLRAKQGDARKRKLLEEWGNGSTMKLNKRGTADDDGGYGSENQQFYAPEDSQKNRKTNVARIFWHCAPQSEMNDPNFMYQLSDDQYEMTLRVTKPGELYNANVQCFADQLGISKDKLVNGGTDDAGWKSSDIGDFVLHTRIMGTDNDSWFDMQLQNKAKVEADAAKNKEQSNQLKKQLDYENAHHDPNDPSDSSAYCNTLTGNSKLKCESMNIG